MTDISQLDFLQFPRRLQLVDGYAGFTGELCGVQWVDGISRDWLCIRRIYGITGGMGPQRDAATGIMISPLGENEHFLVDAHSRAWNEYQPLPEHVAEQQQQIDARLGSEVGEKLVSSMAEAVEMASQNTEKEVSSDEVEGDQADQEERPRVQVAQPELVKGQGPAFDQHERIVAEIAGLNPNDKNVWTFNGKPDATELSRRLGNTVTAEQRDAAWDAHQNATGDVTQALNNVLKAKGARYLRQVCVDRGLQTARSGEDTVKILAEHLSVIEARQL